MRNTSFDKVETGPNAKQTSAERLESAVCFLENTVVELERFVAALSGRNCERPKEDTSSIASEPTVAGVLSGAPNQINYLSEQILKLIAQAKEDLGM